MKAKTSKWKQRLTKEIPSQNSLNNEDGIDQKTKQGGNLHSDELAKQEEKIRQFEQKQFSLSIHNNSNQPHNQPIHHHSSAKNENDSIQESQPQHEEDGSDEILLCDQIFEDYLFSTQVSSTLDASAQNKRTTKNQQPQAQPVSQLQWILLEVKLIQQNTQMYFWVSRKNLKPQRNEVSISREVAQAYGLLENTQVVIKNLGTIQNVDDFFKGNHFAMQNEKLKSIRIAAQVELSFKDQFISRRDQWKLTQSLHFKTLYSGKKFDYANIRCKVRAIFDAEGQQELTSAVIDLRQTKFSFYSKSSQVAILIEASSDLYQFDQNGQMQTEKAVDFVRSYFDRCLKQFQVTNEVSIILYARLFYPQVQSEKELKEKLKGRLKKMTSVHSGSVGNYGAFLKSQHFKFFQDIYINVGVFEVTQSCVDIALNALKRSLNYFPALIFWDDQYCPQHVIQLKNQYPANQFSQTNQKKQQFLECSLANAQKSQILEAINLALFNLNNQNVDQNLKKTGHQLIIVTAGQGVYRVNANMINHTKSRALLGGTPVHLVSLSQKPPYQTPLLVRCCTYKNPFETKNRLFAKAINTNPQAQISQNIFQPHKQNSNPSKEKEFQRQQTKEISPTNQNGSVISDSHRSIRASSPQAVSSIPLINFSKEKKNRNSSVNQISLTKSLKSFSASSSVTSIDEEHSSTGCFNNNQQEETKQKLKKYFFPKWIELVYFYDTRLITANFYLQAANNPHGSDQAQAIDAVNILDQAWSAQTVVKDCFQQNFLHNPYFDILKKSFDVVENIEKESEILRKQANEIAKLVFIKKYQAGEVFVNIHDEDYILEQPTNQFTLKQKDQFMNWFRDHDNEGADLIRNPSIFCNISSVNSFISQSTTIKNMQKNNNYYQDHFKSPLKITSVANLFQLLTPNKLPEGNHNEINNLQENKKINRIQTQNGTINQFQNYINFKQNELQFYSENKLKEVQDLQQDQQKQSKNYNQQNRQNFGQISKNTQAFGKLAPAKTMIFDKNSNQMFSRDRLMTADNINDAKSVLIKESQTSSQIDLSKSKSSGNDIVRMNSILRFQNKQTLGISNLIGIEEEDFHAGVDSRVPSKIIQNPKNQQIPKTPSESSLFQISPSQDSQKYELIQKKKLPFAMQEKRVSFQDLLLLAQEEEALNRHLQKTSRSNERKTSDNKLSKYVQKIESKIEKDDDSEGKTYINDSVVMDITSEKENNPTKKDDFGAFKLDLNSNNSDYKLEKPLLAQVIQAYQGNQAGLYFHFSFQKFIKQTWLDYYAQQNDCFGVFDLYLISLFQNCIVQSESLLIYRINPYQKMQSLYSRLNNQNISANPQFMIPNGVLAQSGLKNNTSVMMKGGTNMNNVYKSNIALNGRQQHTETNINKFKITANTRRWTHHYISKWTTDIDQRQIQKSFMICPIDIRSTLLFPQQINCQILSKYHQGIYGPYLASQSIEHIFFRFWQNICDCKLLPLTTDYFPKDKDIENSQKYHKNEEIPIDKPINTVSLVHNEGKYLEEFICLRLSQNMQIVSQNAACFFDIKQFMFQDQPRQYIKFSIGNMHHTLKFVESQKYWFTAWLRLNLLLDEQQKDHEITNEMSAMFKYMIYNPISGQFQIKYSRESRIFNFRSILNLDEVIADFKSLRESCIKVPQITFILIPIELNESKKNEKTQSLPLIQNFKRFKESIVEFLTNNYQSRVNICNQKFQLDKIQIISPSNEENQIDNSQYNYFSFSIKDIFDEIKDQFNMNQAFDLKVKFQTENNQFQIPQLQKTQYSLKSTVFFQSKSQVSEPTTQKTNFAHQIQPKQQIHIDGGYLLETEKSYQPYKQSQESQKKQVALFAPCFNMKISWIFASASMIQDQIRVFKRLAKEADFELVTVSGIINQQELNPFEGMTLISSYAPKIIELEQQELQEWIQNYDFSQLKNTKQGIAKQITQYLKNKLLTRIFRAKFHNLLVEQPWLDFVPYSQDNQQIILQSHSDMGKSAASMQQTTRTPENLPEFQSTTLIHRSGCGFLYIQPISNMSGIKKEMVKIQGYQMNWQGNDQGHRIGLLQNTTSYGEFSIASMMMSEKTNFAQANISQIQCTCKYSKLQNKSTIEGLCSFCLSANGADRLVNRVRLASFALQLLIDLIYDF